MVECKDNIPPKNMSLMELVFTELDPTGFLGDESERDWVETNVRFADYYGIDLCDEPEAHILAEFVLSVTENPGGATRAPQTPEELGARQHWRFLQTYANLHGLPSPMETPAYGTQPSVVVSVIQSLTLEHSIATPIPPEPIQIRTGNGTVILGEQNPLQCDPAKVDAFKGTTTSKRAPINSTQPYYIYQVEKCGNREYQLATLVTFLEGIISSDVMAYLDFEWEDVIKKFADGLTSSRPGGARGKAFGCCATDAKRVMNYRRTMYQTARRYRKEMHIKHRAKLGKLRRWAVRSEMVRYAARRATALRQLIGYAAACLDPDIPVTRFLYIVSHDIAVDFFDNLLGGPNIIGHVVLSAPSSSENWIG